MKKSMSITLIGLLFLLLAACSNSHTVTINGKEKMVSGDFIEVITKRHQNTVKTPVPKNIKPSYDIVYKKEDVKVYKVNDNILVKNDSDWYTISEDELKTIENEAN